MESSSLKDNQHIGVIQNIEVSDQSALVNECSSLQTNLENIVVFANGVKESKPFIGMQFDSLDEAESFYKIFAREQGFGIRIRSSKTGSRTDEIVSRIYVCCNEGQYKEKTIENTDTQNDFKKAKKRCSTLRTGCGALLKVARVKNSQKWTVKSFSNEHNHDMISPKSVSYLRCHKKMTSAAKSLVEKFNEEGIPTGKVAALFSNVDQQFSDRDCWNYLRDLRRKNLDVGDAQVVLCYFRRKQAENPNFFYAIQCDGDARMVNLFWVDARSRLAYEHFGDAITFDTTYKTNKYSMPFAPFVGLNHHCQSILFGCALLQDESEQSFIWLFETWLEAMHRKAPVSIITDQDLAIRAAVMKVFPKTRHRLCLWHIKKKFPEKLSHIYHKNSTFKRELKRCIRESSSVKEFEKEWHELIVKNNLEQNEWLQGLYEIRNSWIPVYNQNTFFAGMNTTQRSESINSFFDSFVDSTTTLQEFVVKYEKAVDSRYDKERKEDFESRHKSRILKIGSKMEHHAALVYTKNVFNIFQDELVKSNQFIKQKVIKTGSCSEYEVSSCFDSHDSFLVHIDLSSKVGTCDCNFFEFKGILCRHMLAIFHFKNVVEIPNHYILKRWTKEANKGYGICETVESLQVDLEKSAALRSLHVCRLINQLSFFAENSEEMYKVIVRDLDQILQKVSIMEDQVLAITGKDNDSSQQLMSEVNQEVTKNQLNQIPLSINIGDPHISQTKGRKKGGHESQNGRFKSSLEIALARTTVKRRSCQICGGYGHNKRSCKGIEKSTNSTTSATVE